ncbi:hypothetical protein B7P43_G17909 [Cryptotermes secundus]|uniref:Reverse transcriptase Ty1/copia-type domain-containing protein n=2 Tax=Cryptotermes secundus TaxID=105785 RepID=A0A2J7QIE3_9NEOP|nr:hypothetical protein B7P43_G17909 [Cryptotermes secundus]
MKQPEGFEDSINRVCKLKKSLYGLKQAPRCWNRHFGKFLSNQGFQASKEDPCLYVKKEKKGKMILVLYVDDGLVTATNEEELKNFLQALRKEFSITVSVAHHYLGLEINTQTSGQVKISQEAYARKVLKLFNFENCAPVSTPMEKGSSLRKVHQIQNSEEQEMSVNFPYRQAVGALMYLMIGSRPDLAYSVGVLSRCLENPSNEDVIKLKRVLRYIKGTLSYGIVYNSNVNSNSLECYSDADLGGCEKTARSTSGAVVLFAGGTISWKSRRQCSVAISSTEAELVAASEATREVLWLSRLFKEITNVNEVPILQVDNDAAIRLAQDPILHGRTKHIERRHFFIHEKVEERKINVKYVPTQHQVADVMTKPLSKEQLKLFCERMGLMC